MREKKILQKKKSSSDFSWLTQHSRDFLSAGYVAEGVRPEERIREIANRAEEILGIKGFGDKFYGYMQKGFYSLSSPVWSNFGKKKEACRLAVLVQIFLTIWVIYFIRNRKLV